MAQTLDVSISKKFVFAKMPILIKTLVENIM